MKIREKDKVKVITGKDKGKIGTVLRVLKEENRVLVEGVNMVKRHVKPGTVSKEGGIVSIEKPIDISNVMYYSEKLQRPVRIAFKNIEGKKYRVARKTGEVLDERK